MHLDIELLSPLAIIWKHFFIINDNLLMYLLMKLVLKKVEKLKAQVDCFHYEMNSLTVYSVAEQ